MTTEAVGSNVAEIAPEEPIRFLNYYSCPRDGTVWSDKWSCKCNDRCPNCNAEIEPYRSEDISMANPTARNA